MLVAAGGVADRAEPEVPDPGDVGELRRSRNVEATSDGAGPLLGGHPGHAGEVDGLGRVERPAGHVDVSTSWTWPASSWPWTCVAPVSMAATLTTPTSTPGATRREPWRLTCAAHQDDDGQDEGDRGERGAHCVGELRRLDVLEAPDPRDADGAGERPATDGDDVHDRDHRRRRPPARDRQDEPGD